MKAIFIKLATNFTRPLKCNKFLSTLEMQQITIYVQLVGGASISSGISIMQFENHRTINRCDVAQFYNYSTYNMTTTSPNNCRSCTTTVTTSNK